MLTNSWKHECRMFNYFRWFFPSSSNPRIHVLYTNESIHSYVSLSRSVGQPQTKDRSENRCLDRDTWYPPYLRRTNWWLLQTVEHIESSQMSEWFTGTKQLEWFQYGERTTWYIKNHQQGHMPPMWFTLTVTKAMLSNSLTKPPTCWPSASSYSHRRLCTATWHTHDYSVASSPLFTCSTSDKNNSWRWSEGSQTKMWTDQFFQSSQPISLIV